MEETPMFDTRFKRACPHLPPGSQGGAAAHPKGRLSLGIVALLALVCPSLGAQGVIAGGQIGMAVPAFNFKDAVPGGWGAGAGLHVLLDLDDRFALRPRVEFWDFQGPARNATPSSRVTMASYGVDLVAFRTGGTGGGLYSLVGFGGLSDSAKANGKTARDTSLQVTPGLGYQFNDQFGLELRYSAVVPQIHWVPGSTKTNLNYFALVACYRFN
jgi:hypothetical protein